MKLKGLDKILLMSANAKQASATSRVDAHVAGTAEKHAAEKVTYSGSVVGATDVKQGIDLLKARVDEIITTPISGEAAAQELIDARGGKATLGDRFGGIDSQLADVATQINSLDAEKSDITYVDTKLANNYLALDTKINSQASGSPKNTFATLALLQADATANTVEGKKSIYLVTADGKWYYWNGSAWTAGGIYQSTGIADSAVTPQKTNFMIPSRNKFDGIYHPLVLTITGPSGSYRLVWRGLVGGEVQNTAIVPIEASKTYTVKLKDTSMNDVFRIAILNTYPDLSIINNTEVDATISYDDTKKEFTFTNTADGRYLLVYVSSVGNEPRMQVEEGSTSTSYVEHLILRPTQLSVSYENLDDKTLTSIEELAVAKSKEILSRNTSKIVDLVTAQQDEAPVPAASLNTVEADLIHYKVGDRGLKVNVLGASGHQVDYIPNQPYSLLPTSVIGAWIWIEDSTKLLSLIINLYLDSGLVAVSSYSASTAGGIKNGWNLFRWSVPRATTPLLPTHSIHRIRVTGASSGATCYTIGHIWAECPPKAQLLFIQDGAEAEFLTTGYPDLKARNIPCTWGLAPGRIGVTNHINEKQIYELSLENNNSMSFHSWNVSVTNTMTADQLKDDCYNTLKWLRERGYTGGIVRAAFTQNLAQQVDAVKNMFLALPMSTGGEGRMSAFPFVDKFDIKRYALHAYNNDANALITLFNTLKNHHCLMVCYSHLVVPVGNTVDISSERWGHFLSLIDQALGEGWLEGVTFEQLLERCGISNRPGNKDWVQELYEKYGSYANLKLR